MKKALLEYSRGLEERRFPCRQLSATRQSPVFPSRRLAEGGRVSFSLPLVVGDPAEYYFCFPHAGGARMSLVSLPDSWRLSGRDLSGKSFFVFNAKLAGFL